MGGISTSKPVGREQDELTEMGQSVGKGTDKGSPCIQLIMDHGRMKNAALCGSDRMLQPQKYVVTARTDGTTLQRMPMSRHQLVIEA